MLQGWKKSMQKISAYAGQRKDYVQGGGGNTSVKLDEELMAIKASGYTLSEVTEERGYVTVGYQKIRQYYDTVDVTAEKDFEKESLAVNLDNIVLLEGMENKRPSVEVGFHSLLKKCVIHTHSVYANVLCCSEEGYTAAERIFKNTGVSYVFIPYIDPGFRLTLAVKQAAGEYEERNGNVPDVIFLENHGVIVHADDDKEAIALHETVNKRIIDYFSLPCFPIPSIIESGTGYKSGSNLLIEFVKAGNGAEFFGALRLYPDQLVYLGGKLGNEVVIDTASPSVTYAANGKEAQTLEETMLGVAYVIDAIRSSGLTLKQMKEKDAAFINNWESEKYRKSLVGKQGI